MTNTEIIQAIRKEIERLKGIGGIVPLDNRKQKTGYESALIDIEFFLDTIESEKLMNQELEAEIDKYREEHLFDMPAFQQVARHFAEWGAEHLKK